MQRAFCALFCTLLAVKVAALPQGGQSISGACDSMTPAHGVDAQSASAPYRIATSTATISPQQQISIVIVPLNGSYFKGFMIEVRPTDSNSPVGTFIATPPSTTIICNGSVFVHSSPTAPWNTSLSVIWYSPSTLTSQSYQVWATIVQEQQTFWVKIPGPRLSVAGTTATPTGCTPTYFDEFSNNDCGSAKGCFSKPVVCLSQDNCDYFFSWKAQMVGGQRYYNMELKCRVLGWCAVGFSLDNRMGNDYVIMALQDANGNWNVQNRFNPNTSNIAVSSDKATLGLSNVSVCYVDGEVRAHFTRVEAVAGGDNQVFDFVRPYFLLLANGTMSQGTPLVHQQTPAVSVRPTTFLATMLTGNSGCTALKAANIFWLAAWLLLASVRQRMAN